MSIMNILATGMRGIQSGIARTQSTPLSPNTDISAENLAAGIIAQRQGEIQVKASADVVAAGSQMLGSLIDIRG